MNKVVDSAIGDDLEDLRYRIRHSTAHVMAQAVQDLFPNTALGIGPPIKDGFYYDFSVSEPFTPADLERIEKRMKEIIKQGQTFQRRVVSQAEAESQLRNEPFKLELIETLSKGGVDQQDDAATDIGGAELTVYDNIDPRTGETKWSDLCRGPHVSTTKEIPAFALTRVAAAYWRGSEKNPQLQRIYGTAWESKEALTNHLALLAEAEKRDHRKLGQELDLFSFPEEIGSGLAVFHPKGGVIRKLMEDYSRRRHEEAGYEFVYSPHVAKSQLFETSGHLQWFAEGMYPPMQLDAETSESGEIKKSAQDYYLKPMNCPFHMLIYRGRGRSYRELPIRLFEFGTVYRYEKSGVVHGLTRARGFTQDDAHIFCTPEQMPTELDSLLRFVLDLLRDYGLSDFYLEISTRDPEKSMGTDQEWEAATAALKYAAEQQNLPLTLDEGGAAFYGPKVSVQAKDALGRSWQLSTIQVDFQLPQRFDLEYQAADGTRQRPIMIHRALFGSMERFFAVLLEHYGGAFPPWLAPVQVVAIPVAADYAPYLAEIVATLQSRGVRAELDDGDERMQKKIRNAQKQKVPFMLIAGETDASANKVSFRYRDGTQDNGIDVAEAVERITQAIDSRVQV